jgi:hypothetical protein
MFKVSNLGSDLMFLCARIIELFLKSDVSIKETKITRDMLTEQLGLVPGFTAYFAFSKARGAYF